jgi:hypothetical protein
MMLKESQFIVTVMGGFSSKLILTAFLDLNYYLWEDI